MRLLILLIAIVAGSAYADVSETTKFCSRCHGENGTAVSPRIPNLAGQYAEYLFREMKLYKAHTRESQAMSAVMDTVPDDQLLPLAKYYSEKVPVAHSTASSPEMIKRGGALYFNDNNALGLACADCHGTHGEGTADTEKMRAFPRVAGQQLEFLVTALQQYKQGKKATLLGMRSAMHGLSDSDLAALAAYMNSMKP